MFPARFTGGESVKRFPRVRGDVPTFSLSVLLPRRFSPRARGCSCQMQKAGGQEWVFPACAGMFPPLHYPMPHTNRFPRVRGDVPVSTYVLGSVRRFSPRARGCSASTVSFDVASWVFPACAGMFLSPLGRCSMVRPFSPRARGCSHVIRSPHSHQIVFPACAGMFPRRAGWVFAGLRFPRVRGDVP